MNPFSSPSGYSRKYSLFLRFRKYLVIARVSLSNAVAYRAALVSGFCFYTMFIYVFMCLWRAIYQQGSVQGYTLVQIVWYLVMTELVTFGCRNNIYAEMNDEVKSGSIAYLVGRPTHYIFYQFARSLGQIALNLFSFGVLAVVLGLLFVGPLPGFHPRILPPLALSVALGVAINFFFLMLIGLSSFIIEDNFGVYLIYQKLTFMLGVFLPVEFLPGWLQGVAKSLPFSYVAWAPARLLVDFSWPLFWQLVPRQAFWTLSIVCLTLLCYHFAQRRLQAHGG